VELRIGEWQEKRAVRVASCIASKVAGLLLASRCLCVCDEGLPAPAEMQQHAAQPARPPPVLPCFASKSLQCSEVTQWKSYGCRPGGSERRDSAN